MRPSGGNLPADLTSFVGRRAEVAALRAQLGESRLVTLTGAGGVGKTRIALRVAAESQRAFPDGAWLVELAALEEAALLVDTVATALGLETLAPEQRLSQLSRRLAGKQMLVVLDNCEHLSTACAALVSSLLRDAPMLRFLITSRHSLGVIGEHIVTVLPLSIPRDDGQHTPASLAQYDSVALLSARASDTATGFEITAANSELVARLCERLDGIPLAIELAAARLRTFSVAEVLDRLDRRFQLLTAGNDGALPRQQTLAALVGWSHHLCSTQERALWERLSVFAGGFTLAAVEATCSGGDVDALDVADLIDSLVRKSILIVERFGEPTRYRLLETLRAYGSDRLAETSEPLRWERAHLDYFLELAARSHDEWCGPDQAKWLARLRADHANLRVAFDRCLVLGRPADACAFAASLLWFWIAGSNLGEGRLWLDQALTASANLEPCATRAQALWVDAYLALLQGQSSVVAARLDEAEKFAVTTHALRLSNYIAQLRGMSALFAGDLVESRAQYERALAGHVGRGDDAGAVGMLFQLAVVCISTGDHETAASLCRQSLQLSADFGERWAVTYASWALGVNQWSQADHAGAVQSARAGLPVTLEFNDRLGMVHMVELLCWVAASEGSFVESARFLGSGRAAWAQLGTSIEAFGAYLHNCEVVSETRLRAALGDSEVDALLVEGASVPIESVARAAIGAASDDVPAQKHHETSLSARELEVAALVSRGLTNRSIAAELVLSTRTVDSHVKHILEKLRFRSRTQIAGWFAERSE